jgi:hypothetical protein
MMPLEHLKTVAGIFGWISVFSLISFTLEGGMQSWFLWQRGAGELRVSPGTGIG